MFNQLKCDKKSKTDTLSHHLRHERLEDRRLLAIVWQNEFDAPGSQFDPNFDVYLANEPLARAIVHRAIDDWERVIESFNYGDDGDADTNRDLKESDSPTALSGYNKPGSFHRACTG